VFGRRRFGRRRERFTAEHHVWRGHHRLAVAFVVTAAVTVTAAVFVTAAAAARFHVILLVVAVEERRVRRGAGGGTRGGDDHGSGARAGRRLFVAAGRTARRVRHRGRGHGHSRTGRFRVRGRFRRGGRGGRRPVRLRLVSGRHRGAHCRPRICLVRRMLFQPCGSVDGRRRPVCRHHRM